jgi:hypothetical protein
VLHDLFAMPFAQVAAVLDRSPEATRQLASRARRRVRVTPSPLWPLTWPGSGQLPRRSWPLPAAETSLLSAGRAGTSRLVLVDGAVGIMFAPAGQLEVVLAMTISEDQIRAIDVIADPHRLRQLDLALLPD